MQENTIKIDFGIRIITLGSIAIAIATFVRQNNAQADTFLFILSGIFFLFSGIGYVVTNLAYSEDKKAINDVIEEQTGKYAFLPILFLKRGFFVFALHYAEAFVSFFYSQVSGCFSGPRLVFSIYLEI
jgi:hypothetical protein